MVVEFYSNYLRNTSSFAWLMDIGITTAMLVVVLLSYTNIQEKWLTTSFSLIAFVFLAFSWVNQGGIYGRSEYNYLALLVVLGIVHSGRMMVVLLILALLVLIGLVSLWEYDFSFFEPYVLSFSEWPVHYIGVVVLVTLFVYYLRMKNDEEVNQIDERNTQLSRRAIQMDIENLNLLGQQKEFEQINEKLELEIAKRKQALDEQSKTLEEFMALSLKEFQLPLQSTLIAIREMESIDGSNVYVNMLSKSSHNLQNAYQEMKVKLKNNIQ